MHHLHVSFTILQYTVFVLYVGTESLECSNVQSKVNNNTQIISQNTVNLKNKFMFDKKERPLNHMCNVKLKYCYNRKLV